MTQRLILCADDFGLSEEVSHGIIALARDHRLSATSCMTESKRWPEDARLLSQLDDSVCVGMHFNLTEGLHPDDRSLGTCILQALTGQLGRAELTERFTQQLDLFEQHAGRAPDFVDGHQHVHILPGVRQVVFDVLQQRYVDKLPALRHVGGQLRLPWPGFKSLVIQLLQTGFHRQALSRGFTLNRHFAGIYNFADADQYASMMQDWLANLPDNTLMMCHPARFEHAAMNDSMDQARQREYEFFASETFTTLLNANNRVLAPFRAQKSASSA